MRIQYLLPKNRLDVSHYLKRVPREAKKNITVEKTYQLRRKVEVVSRWDIPYAHKRRVSVPDTRDILSINEQEKKSELCLRRKMEYEDTYLPKTRKDVSNYLEQCTWATWIDIFKCTGKNRKLLKAAQRWGHVERWHIPSAKNQTRKSVDTRTWGTDTKKRKKIERKKKTKLTNCHKSKSSAGSVFPDDMHQETPKELASCHKKCKHHHAGQCVTNFNGDGGEHSHTEKRRVEGQKW